MFTHLHVHTEYSLLDGSSRIGELISRCRELNMDSVAITDHGVMYGCVEFYSAAKNAGIKPIIGCEMYVCSDMNEKTFQTKEYSHLILLCKDNTGYKNLMKLLSLAYIDGFYYKPRIDYKLLRQYCQGLICSSACLAGDIPRYIMEGDLVNAKKSALELKEMFGPDFYLELQDNGIEIQKQVNKTLIEFSEELDIPLIATNDVHYIYKEDAKAQDVLMCIQTARYLDETDRLRFETEEFYFKTAEEMADAFKHCPQAIENTQIIAQKCNVELDFSKIHLPAFKAPEGKTNFEYLCELCNSGLSERYCEITQDIKDRLDYELGVINQMGFTDYFLITHDFVSFAKKNNIAVGPGRGSAAGSLCSYVLKITDLDPIKYKLLFERFLNPERISMPDIDIDFCMERRGEVIAYVVEKYGSDHVSQIITFGTLGAKQVVRDVARALRVPPTESDRLSKMIPFAIKMTIERALRENPKLQQEYDTNPTFAQIIDIGKKLEGLPRHASVHAAGVVITKNPVYEYVPLQVSTKDLSVMTQYPMGDLEKLGLLKMDFLGLRNLTVIQQTLNIIEQNHGIKIDLEKMDFDDKETYKLIASGDTDGVFQLESPGMRSLMTSLMPKNLNDIMIGISLFRPGPMDSIPEFLKWKKHPEQIRYLTPRLQPILEETFGAIVYQEQVMEIVRDLAGYSLGRSDLVRRAMAKKKASVMEAERNVFIHGETVNGEVVVEGAVRRGTDAKTAEKIFNQMIDFAAYAFNKSHACCYAAIAYYTAYLKCHYKLEFLTSLINSFISFPDKLAEYMQYAKSHGIKILPPSINCSQSKFSVENDSIRFGLLSIRDVGERAVEEIIEERKKGKFESFADFISRAGSLINKRMLEGLIVSGCFDEFGFSRSVLMNVYGTILEKDAVRRKNALSGQFSMFDNDDLGLNEDIEYPDLPEYNKKHLLTLEKRATGIYLSGHPLDEIGEVNAEINVKTILGALESIEEKERFESRTVELTGILTQVKKRLTRQKKMMARAVFEDLFGSIDMIVFPKAFENFEHLLNEDAIVKIRGKVDISDDEVQIILDAVEPYTENEFQNKMLYIKIEKDKIGGIFELKSILADHKGLSEYVVRDEISNRTYKGNITICYSKPLIDLLKDKYGENNVILK